MPGTHKTYWVYFLSNQPHGTLYIWMTNSLHRRMWQHKTGLFDDFSKRYGLKRLDYFEEFRDVSNAISRETQLKGWLRARKVELLSKENPLWRDLSADWFDDLKVDSSLS